MWHTTRLGIRRPRSDSTVWSFRLLCTLAAVSSANWSLVYVCFVCTVFTAPQAYLFHLQRNVSVDFYRHDAGFLSVTWLLCAREVTSSNPGGGWSAGPSDKFLLRLIIRIAPWASHSTSTRLSLSVCLSLYVCNVFFVELWCLLLHSVDGRVIALTEQWSGKGVKETSLDWSYVNVYFRDWGKPWRLLWGYLIFVPVYEPGNFS